MIFSGNKPCEKPTIGHRSLVVILSSINRSVTVYWSLSRFTGVPSGDNSRMVATSLKI